ncbi:MAG: hypothetical protein IJK97_02120, partial [Thermoguttaceae bacterium]|nr:hypothetical protein [Thermoguttaceae bacterium]
TRNDPGLMEPCGKCESCRQMLAGTHPDLLRVSKPEDRAFIPIDLFIGPKEARRQVGLCAELAKKPIYEKRKIAIIDDADFLNIEGANSMLKTLEEPPKNSVLILLGTTASRQLPTIRSRCQIIRFKPLETDVVEEILRERRAEQLALAESVSQTLGKKKTPKKADAANILSEDLIPLAASASGGSVQEALALADEGFWDFRARFLDRLASGVHDRIALGKEIDEQLELVGKVPARRRARLRVIVETAADFFRRLAFWLAGNPPSDPLTEKEWRPILTRAAETWPFDAEGAAFTALKTSDYLELIQRNVHQPTLLDAWLDELVRIYAADPTALALTPWGLKPNP